MVQGTDPDDERCRCLSNTEISRDAVKKEFLKLLEVDEEFRLAVAAKLGLLEILTEIRRLREDFDKLYRKSLEHDKRFEAIERKLLEHDKRFEVIEKKLLEHDKHFEAIERKLLEHDKRFEVIERKLLEHDKRFEAIEKKLLEHDKRFEEFNKRFEAIERKLLEHDRRFEAIERRLEEHDRKFNQILEEIKKIWEAIAELNRRLSRVEDAVGALAESTYAKFTLDALVSECGVSNERIISWHRNIEVDGEEINLLLVTERRVFVVEVKVRPRHADVGALLSKAEIVSRRYPDKKVVAVLTGTRIGMEVASYAVGKGVRVLSW